MRLRMIFVVTILAFWAAAAQAGTTGKIAGTVKDAQTGMPLPGVNVVLEGTRMGAATDMKGYYVILNVPPGVYTMKFTMIGYAEYKVRNVRVQIDLTTTIDAKLKPVVLAGQEVVVVAQRPVVVKDVAASQANIDKKQIESIPMVQRVQDVVGLQAGIIGLSIRGGGSDQVAFMVDGFTLRDERTNQPYTAISLSAIKEIQVQTGGFDAEYGNIRSGIINVVTREGDRNRYSGTITYRYSPPAPKHFGPSGYAPDSYWNRPFLDDAVCWTGTAVGEPFTDQNGNGVWDQGEPFVDFNGDGKRTFWDDYTQRQYPQFEGWYAVSERTLQDNDPNNDLTPYAAQKVYKWQHRKQGDIKIPDFNIDGGFGGPVPFISHKLGDLRFFLSHRQEQTAYLIPLSRKAYRDFSTQLKLTSNISPGIKLTISGLYGEIHAVNNNNVGLPGYFYSTSSVARILSRRSYIDAIMYGNDYWCPTSIYRHMISAKITHTLSPRTFYDLKFERVGNFYHTAPGRMRDTTKVLKIGNNYWVDEAPYGYMPYPSSGINGIRMGVGMSNSRDYSRILTYTMKFDLTSQIGEHNQVKTGFEFVYNDHNVRYGAVELTLPAGRPWSIWRKHPIRGGVYIQDKLEYQGLIAKLGVRMDYSDPGGRWYALDPYDKRFYSSNYTPDVESQLKKEPTKKQLTFSPRLGISHPITEKSKLYFNYGHFRDMPRADRLYIIQRVTEGSISRIGNPNLPLQKTVAYELGYEHELFNQYLLRLAAYYKDVSHQSNYVRYISADRKVNYLVTEDKNYQDIRGFEITLEKRLGRWFTGFVNYTYMVSTTGYFGRLRYYENPAEQREYERQNIYQEKPLPRPYMRANLSFHTPRDFGPSFFGINWLGEWRLNVMATWRKGYYLTWTRGVAIPGIQYNVKWPDYYNVDMQLGKVFKVGRYNVRFFLDASNVFNFKYFTPYAFVDGNDYRSYMDSLLWPKKIGEPLGYTVFGHDKIGDLRPSGVKYDPLEPNPNNDPEIAKRNRERIKKKSYIDNPNLKWLYYLNPRDVFFGIKVEF